MTKASSREKPRLGESAVLGYALPLAVGAVIWALTIGPQSDRIAFDEVREGIRAFEIARGEVGLVESWQQSVHPPLVPALTALFLHVLPPALAIRIPETLFGFLALPLIVLVGRRAPRREVGLIGGLLVASSPIWWAYACAVSLDLPLAAIAALGAVATVERRNVWLCLLAAAAAAATKRQGATLVVVAMLLAVLAGLRGVKFRRRTWVLGGLGVIAVAAFGLWRYLAGGLRIFGSTTHIHELIGTAPTFVVFSLLGALALGVVYLGTERAGRDALLPLFLYTLPFAIAPLVSSHTAPRYFLPAFPTGALLVAAAIWVCGGGGAQRVRWLLSAVLLVGWFAVQWRDLHQSYWPMQRGGRDVVRWIAANVPPDESVYSASGWFLQLAALQEGVPSTNLVEIDRTTCARLEDRLDRDAARAFVVLPLDRDVGWPADLERHAQAMGLELRALVRRDVPPFHPSKPFAAAGVESLGPPDGTPVTAIFASIGKPDRDALGRGHGEVSLLNFDDPRALRRWRNAAVQVQQGPSGVSLSFAGIADQRRTPSAGFGRVQLLRRADASVLLDSGALPVPDLPNLSLNALPRGDVIPTCDWHHHRWLELELRADETALEEVHLTLGMRTLTKVVRLNELYRAPGRDGWRRLRLDLRPMPIEQLSQMHWLALSAWQPLPGQEPPAVELRALRLIAE
jgi:hypothetical protein